MKKKFILIFLLPLLCFAVFIAYCYISTVADNNKKYYFPEIETYLKIYNPPFKDYGYIIWGKDSNLTFSENIDYIKIKKSEISWVNFIIDPLENSKIFMVDRYNNAIQVNQVNFSIEKISGEDPDFFEEHIVAGTCTHQPVSPYIDISVEGYLQSVFFTDNDMNKNMIKVEPLK